ncbi:MAG: FixH family protein [Armatimonadota bacterium]
MSFTEPIYLLLLIPLWGWVLWTGRRMLGVSRARRRLILALRLLLVLLVVLALAGWTGVMPLRKVCTVFVLDESASVSEQGREKARAFVREALAHAPNESLAALIAFGEEPLIEWMPAPRKEMTPILSRPNPDGTDIASALRLALAAFPDGYAKRIVLLSDGNETVDDALAVAQVAQIENVPIDTVVLPTGKPDADALIESLEAPAQVKVGEPYQVRIVVQSRGHAEGKIVLDRDGTPLKSLPVRLTPGVNTVTTTLRADKAGVQRLRAVLEVAPDAEARNNLGLALVRVQGKPHVLIAEGKRGISDGLALALKTAQIDVTRVDTLNFPAQPEELQNYDAIVLNDYPATAFSPQQMLALQTAVRDTGIGLVMIGGEQSYQPGGYYGTPIAEMLPVDLNIRHRKVFHAATVILIVDASGSMNKYWGQHKVAHLAAEASIQTLKMLRPADRFGVIISSHGSDWLLPEMARTNADPFGCEGRQFQGCHGRRAGQPPSAIFPAEQRDEIIAVLQRVYGTGGGIFVRGSLEMALRGMSTEPPNRARHIIMLADADDCDEQEGSVQLAKQMRAMGITLSVVAFGDGSATSFLRQLARAGGGRFYQTVDPHSLPRLFTSDVSQMTRQAIEVGAFLPKVVATDERLQGIDWSRVPPLLAYNLVSERPLAQTLMRTHKDDPLLAVWRYGLGTVIAFTSDAQPRWSQRWFGWQDFMPFWAQVIRSALRPSPQPNLGLHATVRQGQGVVELQAFTPEGEPLNHLNPQLTVTSPSGKRQVLTMQLERAGRYYARFPIRERGLYQISTEGDFGSGKRTVLHTSLAIPYPVEYRFSRENRALLEQLAAITGGRLNPAPRQAFDLPPRRQPATRDLWSLALLLSLLLLMVDISARRIVITLPEAVAAVWARLRVRRPRRQPVLAGVQRLQTVKARAATRWNRVGSATPQRTQPTVSSTPAQPVATAPPPSAHAPPDTPPARSPSGDATLDRLLQRKRHRR